MEQRIQRFGWDSTVAESVKTGKLLNQIAGRSSVVQLKLHHHFRQRLTGPME